MTKTKPRRSAHADDLPAEAPSLRYVESSALVAAILELDAEALSQIRAIGQCVTSALTLAETARALTRARIAGRIGPAEERSGLRDIQEFKRQCSILEVSGDVLTRAGRPFPVEPVRTLDAIHLATIESLGETPQLLTVVTRDQRIARNARALGYAVV